MATLTGELISETYDSLLKVTDNNTITGIKKRITDGFGNDIPLLLSSTDIEIDGTLILSALTDLAPATKFLSLKADNTVGFRTSSELLSDIGGASSSSISGTTGRLSKFTSSGAVGNSILNEIGNVIHLTDGTSSYASFGIINPGVDNDCYIGSTINNDFIIRVNNTEALRIDTNFRLKIANIQNALGDTDKFLVSEDGVVKYRTGSEVLSDIGGASASLYVPYSGATSDVNLGAFNITATSLIKAGGVDTQFLKADGRVDNNNYLTANDLPSTLSLYATNVPADVTDYFKLVTTIDDPDYNTIAVDVPTGAITTTNQLIASLVSPVNLINGNPGVFNVTTTGNITRLTGSGEAEFFFRIYKRDSGGVETLVGTSGNTIPVINTGYSEFFATAIWNDGIFDVTDSIVLKYYANRISGGSNPTYQFQFGGDQPVRTIVPIPTAVIPNIFLEELADVEDGTASNNDGIFFDSSVSLWKYKSVSEVLGYTPANDASVVHLDGTETITGRKTFNNVNGLTIDTVSGALVPTKIFSSNIQTLNYAVSNTSNNFLGTFLGTVTANRTYSIPDISGTLALTSQLSAYVPYTGATGAVNLGAYDLTVNGVNIGRGGGSIDTNTRVGSSALGVNTTGFYNSAFGYYALSSNIIGKSNSAFGLSSLRNNLADNNTAIGAYSGNQIISGDNNTLSSNSVYLGYDTRPSANGNTNEIVIGYAASGGGSNSATLGNTSIATTILHGNTSIGYTTNPSLYKLDVNGTGRFAGTIRSTVGNNSNVFTSVSATTGYQAIQLANTAGNGVWILGSSTGTDVFTNGSAYATQIGTLGDTPLQFGTNSFIRLTIASTGAATFSSSVSIKTTEAAEGLIILGRSDDFGVLRFKNAAGSANKATIYTNPNNLVFDVGSTSSAMTITSGGNVGIGTTSPATNLHVKSSSGSAIFRIEDSAGNALGRLQANAGDGNINLFEQNGYALTFGTNNTERMRITSVGNVLIGTTTAGTDLTRIASATNSANCLGLVSTDDASNGGYIFFRNSATNAIGNISRIGTTNAVAYNTTSDYRLKEDFREIKGLEKLSDIKVYDFKWKDNIARMDGVLAHELQEIIPYAVTGEKDAKEMQSVDYSKLVPVMIKAIQELNEKITQLENK